MIPHNVHATLPHLHVMPASVLDRLLVYLGSSAVHSLPRVCSCLPVTGGQIELVVGEPESRLVTFSLKEKYAL